MKARIDDKRPKWRQEQQGGDRHAGPSRPPISRVARHIKARDGYEQDARNHDDVDHRDLLEANSTADPKGPGDGAHFVGLRCPAQRHKTEYQRALSDKHADDPGDVEEEL
jgi:hypothetical protein